MAGRLTPRQNATLQLVRQRGSVRVVDIAAELGVVPMTVRRDLDRLAAEGLVDRVHGGAVLPTSAPSRGPARVRSAGRSGALEIGMLVPSNLQQHRELVQGAEAAVRTIGARLTVTTSDYDPDRDRAEVDRLLEGRVDGLLVTPSSALLPPSGQSEWITSFPVPTVILERRLEPPNRLELIDSVASDHEYGALMAIRHLTMLGHRRIGLFAADTPTTPWLVRAFRVAEALGAVERGCPEQIDHARQSATSADSYLTAVAAAGVTAVVGHPDPEAALLLRRVISRGWTVPEDLSIVAYDDIVADLVEVPMTAVAPPRFEAGRVAVLKLARRIREGPAAVPHHVRLTPRLNPRRSTGPRGR